MKYQDLITNWRSCYLRSRFWIRDFFNGSQVRKPYNYLKHFYKLPFNEATLLQKKRLSELLNYYRENSRFYSKIESLELKDFPVMNKLSINENYDDLKVDIPKIPNQKGPVFIQSTSGSTGTPFKIPQDTVKRNTRIAELKFFGELAGFKSHHPLVHLRTWNKWQSKTKKQISRENIIPFDIAKMGNNEFRTLHDIIQKNNSYSIRGYASSLDLFEKFLRKNNLKCPSIKIIFSISETLHDDVRENIKETLECEIISQYANEECGVLGQDLIPTFSKDNIMILNHANYIFECLKFESDKAASWGELGRIVITDLSNHAFPIIRYDTGDVGIFKIDKSGWPILEKLYGRRLDVCYTTNGDPLSPMTIGRVMKHFDKVNQWQFIQESEKKYRIKVITEETISYLNEALHTIKTCLGNDAEIIIEKTNEIPVLASGKRKPVINKWKF